jgi:cell fate regulator YaaT (PSP1 superfamily)
MPLVVGVSFRRVGKVYYFDPGVLELHEGDFAIAETARGVEFGEVVLEPRHVPDEELVAPLKSIIRVASGADLEREAANRDKEKHAFGVCERRIAEHNLPMKLLDAEYAFDGSQVTFSFSAEGRVDFRELVKDVAGALKTKVQLHQIGVRDEAKLIGGYGGCGRSLCCASFLNSFEPISMKMAKDQSLFLNPAKFSGVCGKLMCCLRYEHEFYKDAQKRLPNVGAILDTPQGRVKVVDVNIVSNTLTVQTEEDVLLHIPASQLNLQGLCRKHGVACGMGEKNCQALLADDSVCTDTMDTEDDEPCDDVIDEVLDVQPEEIAVITDDSKTSDRSVPSGVVWREPSDNAAPVVEKLVPSQDGNGGRNANRPRHGGRGRRTSNGSNGGAKRTNSDGRANPDQKKPE